MSGSDTYETKENHMSRRFTIHRIHKQIAVAAIGVALLISPQVANGLFAFEGWVMGLG
jgi:hypothetical protein